MSSICGVYRMMGDPAVDEMVDGMLGALDHWGADDRGRWVGPGIGLGHLMLYNTPESLTETLPSHDSESGLSITADARIDNREDLARALAIPGAALIGLSDSQILLAAYRKWGEGCVQYLRGDFAFAVWDERNRRLFCARDQLGVKPFYYYHAGESFAFATEIKGILTLDFVPRDVDEEWIGDFLCRINLDRGHSLYTAVRRLEPGHSLTVDSTGCRTRQYWEFDTEAELVFGRDAEYVEAFRELLEQAVCRRVRSAYPVGAELSGGLDSSTVCALAQTELRREDREFYTFSQVEPDEVEFPDLHIAPDERELVELLVGHAEITNALFLSDEGRGGLDAIEWALVHQDEPPRITNSLFMDIQFEKANERDVRVVLSGFGGQEAVSDRCGAYSNELLRQRRWRELFRELKGDGSRGIMRSFLGLLFHECLMASGTLRRWTRKDNPKLERLPHRPIRNDLARRLRMEDRTHRSIDLRAGSGTLRERVEQRLKSPDIPARLEPANLAAAGRRIEFRYPLLDLDLIAFYLAVPSRLKRQGGKGRLLFREAVKGLLPDENRLHSGFASANPGELVRRHRDRDVIRARLKRLPPENRLFEFVDLGKIDSGRRTSRTVADTTWGRTLILHTLLILERKLSDVGLG